MERVVCETDCENMRREMMESETGYRRGELGQVAMPLREGRERHVSLRPSRRRKIAKKLTRIVSRL